MNHENGDRGPFFYLAAVTVISVFLIILNVLLGMKITFSVDFLIGYVGLLLIFTVWHAVLTKGWQRSLFMFLFSFLVAFTAEALGVNFGLVFGRYYYTQALGVQVFGVPILAALAWEPIVYAAFSITDILAPLLVDHTDSWLKRFPAYVWMAIVGALATTAWDMMIDPVAVSQRWWVWQDGGAYLPYLSNGVPIQNFIGWLGVAFVINLIYRLMADAIPSPRHSLNLSIYGPIMLYASLFLTSAGVTITILRRPEVALIGLLAMGPFIAIVLTNINIIQRGLSTLLGAGWLEIEVKPETIKTGP
ncbi:MAG: carotenoid biosynthesis protein [Planctomycetes bacterium]|nr:carotenoid biosynthesis protein [Planctomycetota bacterium]